MSASRHPWEVVGLCAVVLTVLIATGAWIHGPAPIALPAQPTITAAETRSTSPRVAVLYHGNTNSHRFHQRSCRYFDCTNCTAKFTSREEAIAAGYRPCGTCKP
jgi:hypothetical protein